MITLNVYFTHVIDTEDHSFATKREAIEIAKSLTQNKVTGFDWNDEEDYKYLLFREIVQCEVEEADMQSTPLYMLVEDIEPSIEGGEFSTVRKASSLN